MRVIAAAIALATFIGVALAVRALGAASAPATVHVDVSPGGHPTRTPYGL